MNTFLAILTVFAPVILGNAQAEPAPSWEKICSQVKNTPLPLADQPKSEALATLKGCDAEALYYGIHQSPDDEKARWCAYSQLKSGNQNMFGGDSILMMIYANGEGVPKNIALAERFACELNGAPAEMEGRLENLEQRKLSTAPSTRFDLCDDITSGYMQGFCVSHQDRMSEVKRSEQLNSLMAKWTEIEKSSFKPLQAAAKEFAKQRSQNEIELSGTGRAAFIIEEEALQKRDFLESLTKLSTNQAPKYSAAQRDAEEKKMKQLLAGILKTKSGVWGTISKDGINQTQKAWATYRSAWVDFAKMKYPQYSSDSVAAWFTKKRNHMLKSFSP